eukprot:TRINITY_DN5663_c0_g3_i1.p2 TRINITY_DN5663_c0_g3~~TRINITY_DN5663_c0_g3_i1.p2  ORF type:complete len:301 (+),score=148.40 TRINITY_DN5663_c0_g3_i1:64-966(+)
MPESMERLGVFKQETYISIGDEYDKKVVTSDRYRGKGFSTGPGKRGQGPDVTFSKFRSINEGDKYVDPGTHEKKYRMEQEKKKITPNGFKYTSPGKKSCGSGNYYGTFTGGDKRPKHETEYDVVRRGELPDKVKPTPKNIVTGSSKKGTFGIADTCIGEPYKYQSDPYDAQHRRDIDEQRSALNKQIGGPFKASSKGGGTFDKTEQGSSRIYSLDRPLPPKKETDTKKNRAILVAFKPSSPGKRGYNCTIGGFPEYKEDPLELQERRKREEAKAAKPQTTWKPISGPKSTPTRPPMMHVA